METSLTLEPTLSDEVCIFDSETCGFHGPIVLFQYAIGEGDPILVSVWKETIDVVIALFEMVASKKVLGFNVAFDWFHIQKMYTTLLLLRNRVGGNAILEDHIELYASLESAARDGPCIKPAGACDLMLVARKTKYQNLMGRDDLKVRRVPRIIAPLVARELERQILIPGIYFARRKDKSAPRWAIRDIPNVPDFVNIVLRFHPAGGLKPIAQQELNLDSTLTMRDVAVPKEFDPVEYAYAPYATAVGRPGRWNGAWPDVIKHHINHWKYNPLARQYATNDIDYPRRIWKKWKPVFDDDDSILAISSGSCRWKGYAVNLKGIKVLRRKALARTKQAPTARAAVLKWITEVLASEEREALNDEHGNPSTKRTVLEELTKLPCCKLCLSALKHEDCILTPHPAAERAQLVLDTRKAEREVDLYDKILLAGRLHAATNVIGARSGRQSGGTISEGKRGKKGGSINPQGINKKKLIRMMFLMGFTHGLGNTVPGFDESLLAWKDTAYPLEDEECNGGDFDKFEVCIADAYYNDPQLHADLVGTEPDCEYGECKFSEGRCPKCSGKPSKPGSIKIHAVVGALVYPGRTYWEIRATDGKDKPELRVLFPKWPDQHHENLYTRAKSAFFALIYFGNAHTLATRLGIPMEDGEVAYQKIMARYPVMALKRIEFYDRFCPLRQPGGIGSAIEWKDPEDKVESMIGFPRYFNLENQVMKALYNLANNVPPEWKQVKVKVLRRDRLQSAAGAVQSALFGAAFQVQGANMRAAGNHVIQSTGAGLTKRLQRRIWDVQMVGIHPWEVRPLNVHDELPTPCQKRVVNRVKKIQDDFIKEHQPLIPLLKMKWKKMTSWAGK